MSVNCGPEGGGDVRPLQRGSCLTFVGQVRIFGRTKEHRAEVAELVDAPDSGSGPGLPGGGSSPLFGT
jgi:hypothetical protein